MRIFERILLATDFSEASVRAFDESVRLAGASGASLILVHAYQVPPAAALSHAPAGVYEDYEQAVRRSADEKLCALVEQARARGADARPLLVAGFPDEEIVAAAGREKADLLVIGTHGRRGAARLFLGSVAARVVTTAPCPVMTVRPAGGA
jgi:universal stress protein A